MTKKKATKTKSTFYSAKGVSILITTLVITSVFALWGLYTIGALRIPQYVTDLFTEETTVVLPSGAAVNIAPEMTELPVQEAVPREEYALALSEMHFPAETYRKYTVTLQSASYTDTTVYYAIQKGADWWVQTVQDDVIMSTALCKSGKVRITDNAQNTSSSLPEKSDQVPDGVSFEERCGILTTRSLVEIIRRAATGEPVEYGGGIRDFSLSFTPARGTGENLFTFSFVNGSGIAEEYVFAFESARILSAKKSIGDTVIYKMELKDYRNDLTEIDTATLFAIQ